jgi:hypothetical protein
MMSKTRKFQLGIFLVLSTIAGYFVVTRAISTANQSRFTNVSDEIMLSLPMYVVMLLSISIGTYFATHGVEKDSAGISSTLVAPFVRCLAAALIAVVVFALLGIASLAFGGISNNG